MTFKPFERMWERVDIARDDSDANLFNTLMYMGEMLTKVVATGLVSAIGDDRDRQRYRQLYQLVRADGIGDWSRIIDETLTGVPAQYLLVQAREEQNELNQRFDAGTWQYESVARISNCLKILEPNFEKLSQKVQARQWFSIFAHLRNKTRGHGAIPSELYNKLCPDLENSIYLFIDNHRLFKRPWAYLYQSLSGKYRVTNWTENTQSLEFLKRRLGYPVNKTNGIYIHFDETQ